MKRIKVILVLLTLVTSNANAVTGFGVPDCGEWITKHSVAHKSWLLGYISASSSYVDSYENKDPYSKITSAEQIFLWMDNYCKANPLNDVRAGAIMLGYELDGRKPSGTKK